MKKSAIAIILILMLNFVGLNVHADDIEYTIIDGKATVTGYTGKPECLDIPSEFEGAPVVGIRDNAFYKCTSLQTVSLPESLEKMGHHCFYGCTSLKCINIPDNVSEIGMGCFYGCSSLNEAILPESLTVLPDSCFRDCISLNEAILPQNITEIQKFCFAGCSSLSVVSLSGHLNDIGDLAFYACLSVKEIYIPDSVQNIGTHSLGYGENGAVPEFSITGKIGSAAERYAVQNGFIFSEQPSSADAFAINESRNSPVYLPEIFLFAGLFFLIMAIISAFRNNRN